MKACRERTAKLKYPTNIVHFEDFGGASDSSGERLRPKQKAQAKSTGQVLKVPGDKSLLQILSKAGLEILSSCLVGNCGMCIVDYCSGEAEH